MIIAIIFFIFFIIVISAGYIIDGCMVQEFLDERYEPFPENQKLN